MRTVNQITMYKKFEIRTIRADKSNMAIHTAKKYKMIFIQFEAFNLGLKFIFIFPFHCKI